MVSPKVPVFVLHMLKKNSSHINKMRGKKQVWDSSTDLRFSAFFVIFWFFPVPVFCIFCFFVIVLDFFCVCMTFFFIRLNQNRLVKSDLVSLLTFWSFTNLSFLLYLKIVEDATFPWTVIKKIIKIKNHTDVRCEWNQGRWHRKIHVEKRILGLAY